MSKRVFFIGGSPCSGKSTIAKYLSKEYQAYYYKVDDFLEKFIIIAAKNGGRACQNYLMMSSDEIWMREPLTQCEEEFLIYDEIAPYVLDYLNQIEADFIITEGTAYTPKVIKKYNLKEYLALIPSPNFQITHYKERKWVSTILEGCLDKRQAFNNWMERDILFAKQVKEECEHNKKLCIINDGSKTKEKIMDEIKEQFKLK